MKQSLTGTCFQLGQHDINTTKEVLSAVIRQQIQSLAAPVISTVVRCEMRLDTCDVFHWLMAQPENVKLFWSPRDEEAVYAGAGVADVIHEGNSTSINSAFTNIRERLAFCNATHYYGGTRFDMQQQPDVIWQEYGLFRFVLPRLEIVVANGTTTLAVNGILHPDGNPAVEAEAMVAAFERMSLPQPREAELPTSFLSRSDAPNREGWEHNINAALGSFAQGETSKIVLARRATLKFDTTLKPLDIVRRLYTSVSHAFVFCFQYDPAHAFLGATPERLYKRTGQTLSTEAVAGTRKRGATEQEDESIREELLHSAKDLHEHEIVRNYIASTLEQYGTITSADEQARLMTLPRLHHLHSRYEAQLADTASEADVLTALHPTPAVGGLPANRAMSAIAELEPFDRGWYAGPVGQIGHDEAEFAVAIRSGIVDDVYLHLYSGAGIVAGSDARAEWEEIENKLGNFLTFIGGHRD